MEVPRLRVPSWGQTAHTSITRGASVAVAGSEAHLGCPIFVCGPRLAVLSVGTNGCFCVPINREIGLVKTSFTRLPASIWQSRTDQAHAVFLLAFRNVFNAHITSINHVI